MRRRPLAHRSGHGVAAWMRCCDAGLRSSRTAGRIGRGHRLPPQLGQIPIKWPSTQRRQAGALVCADHRLRRVGRKIDVATFAVGAQLEHTPGLPDDDRRHTPAAVSSFVGSARFPGRALSAGAADARQPMRGLNLLRRRSPDASPGSWTALTSCRGSASCNVRKALVCRQFRAICCRNGHIPNVRYSSP